jgi:hypothetical protein
MSSALTPLEERIVTILREANGQPLSLPQIEERLAAAGLGPFDTFEVRDAVWQLIGKRKADFTPRRHVKAVGA